MKYNIYIISKEDQFDKIKSQFNKYKNICHIHWSPAEYLKVKSCNKSLLKELKTRHNTKKKKIVAKLGNIAAHRKTLLSIIINHTNNNLILEADAKMNIRLPKPPKKSCYMGGWIIPPEISKIGKKKIKLKPKKGLNKINYNNYKVITTHALFIKNKKEAKEILESTLGKKNIKNYDLHLANNELFDYFYYPPVFVQKQHKSEIESIINKNDIFTNNYGLNNN